MDRAPARDGRIEGWIIGEAEVTAEPEESCHLLNHFIHRAFYLTKNACW